MRLMRSIPVDRCAVVTSGIRPVALARLRAAGLPHPQVLVTAEDVSRGKPDPEGYLAATKELGVGPSRALVIEDAPAGIQAAQAADMMAVAVGTTHSVDKLADADAIATTLEQVYIRAPGPA
jgi:mannitol-1-/sugar-/sorbitol-6-phosphatase